MRLRRKGHSRGPRTRIFFCTDVHGSDQCFRKFLNAGKFYDVDHLILGGDMTGKVLVPITRSASGYSCRFDDHTYTDIGTAEVAAVCRSIRDQGQYPYVGTADEVEALADPATQERVFRRVVYDTVAEWVQLAEDRLKDSGTRCFMAPGNDDYFDIDGSLRGSTVIEFAEGQVITLDDRHEMITTGYSNPTPWATEREMPEPELRGLIDEMCSAVTNFENLVCVLHVPPYGSEIDSAPELDEKLAMSGGAGGIRMAPVGSTAVRDFIEERQPLVGLHGHVHEAMGTVRIGRTLCINPGSEYTDGTLRGAIVELGDCKVTRHQLVAG